MIFKESPTSLKESYFTRELSLEESLFTSEIGLGSLRATVQSLKSRDN